MQKYSEKKSLIFGFGLICLAFILILWVLYENPLAVRRLGVSLRFGFTLIFPALMIIFSTVLFLPQRWGNWAAVTVFAAVFSFPLIGVWASGMTDSYILSGMLPLSDAGSYYANAIQYPLTGVFSDFASRRPLFNGFLVGLAAVSDYNLVQIQSVLIVMAALASALMAIRLLEFLHPVSVSLVSMVIFFYFRRFSGVISSETLGLTLGVLGLFFLWGSIKERKLFSYSIGLFLTAMALLTRAGAFIILPMIILWGVLYLRKEETSIVKFMFLSFIPLLAAYLLNKGIFALYSAAGGVVFSNYSYSLYGLASGGAYWTQIFEDHPELVDLPNQEQTRLAYELAIKLIIAEPMQFLAGIFHEWKWFFSETYYGIWSFISPQPLQAAEKTIAMNLSHVGLYGLSLAGIFRFIKNRKCAYFAFTVFAFIGFLLSVPLAPPSHAYGLRVFAASIWVLGLLPAIGLDGLIPNKWRIKGSTQNGAIYQISSSALVMASVIVFFICLGPMFATRLDDTEFSPGFAAGLCNEGTQSILLPYHPRALVNIEREDEFFLDGRSKYHQGRFMRSLHDIAAIEYVDDFGNFTSPFMIFSAVRYDSGEPIFLIGQHINLPVEPGKYIICGEKIGSGNLYEIISWIVP